MAHREPIRKSTTGGANGDGSSASGTTPPQIPDKLYFRIGEVAKLCSVPAYVLRFWESEFPQLKPNKGGTGQRLYRRRDVEMALRIKTLLYDEGYTIPGARQAFKAELRAGAEPQQTALAGMAETVDARHLTALRRDLQDILNLLSKPAAPRLAVQSIRGPRTLGRTPAQSPNQDIDSPREPGRPRPPAPRPFPKPQLLQPKSPAARLHTLFDSLPLDD